MDTADAYDYQFTFLPSGNYTVAYTCSSSLDSPDQIDPSVTFSPSKSGIPVTAKLTVTIDIL